LKSLCVMPVYNQAKELPALLEKCKNEMPADIFLIVDNGSDDGSEKFIEKSGFEFVRLPRNYGIGYALMLGAEKALERDCNIVVHIAGNGKMLPEEMNRVMAPIKEGKADHVVGSRFLPGGKSPNLPAFRKKAIPWVVNNLVRLLFRTKVTDATNGYRAYKTELLRNKQVKWQEKWLYHYQFEYYIYAKALKLGYRSMEVGTSMIYPADGRKYSKIKPIIGWWELLEAWILVGLGIK
jgi:dolichol-phosphate mannosyltransferase